MSSTDKTITVELRREDAYVIVLGPLDYVLSEGDGRTPRGGSAKRARIAIAHALGLETVAPDA